MAANPMYSVLIVDESSEAREVLKTALQRLGMRIFEASRAQQGVAMARECHPDLIVLDLEAETADASELTGNFAATAPEHPATLVMLGTAQRRPAPARGSEFISKPYHYAPLIRKIESLLAG
ncbi:MAG TPA: response regulator [Pirellulales bacterium]|jgi:CheY-like chemotaxis protein|nr:response regulator [Pirellulales bacterium]